MLCLRGKVHTLVRGTMRDAVPAVLKCSDASQSFLQKLTSLLITDLHALTSCTCTHHLNTMRCFNRLLLIKEAAVGPPLEHSLQSALL